ncbi:MAG: hypothetical protein QOE58_2785 [Actinomycetota bacterium]|jgi:hypothetical protein|nr:hypothetical protein [Actinomycetota bacterium]
MADAGAGQPVRVGGYFSAVPMHLTAALTVHSVYVRGGPWQPPPLYGLLGSRADTPDEVLLLISNETPIELVVTPVEMTGEDIERLHFDKFCTDWLIVQGGRPYESVAPGPHPSKPPDFVASRSGHQVGVDCVQFAVENRRLANARFSNIKRAVAGADPNRFAHLAGLLIYVWVQEDDELAMPLGGRQRAELLDALSAYRFQPGTGETLGSGLPAQAPDLGIESAGGGWRFYGTPILVSAPASPFFFRTGFEMAFVYGSEHTARQGWDELRRRVIDHDQSAIQELIVTVGGPDKNGYIHPSEEAILDLMLQDIVWSYEPKHLSAIYIHGWETGRIVRIHPDVGIVNPGLYQGLVAPHQPLTPR